MVMLGDLVEFLLVVFYAVVLVGGALWFIHLILTNRRWKRVFGAELEILFARIEDENVRRKVAELLMLSSFREGYPKDIREILEREAGRKFDEVMREYGF